MSEYLLHQALQHHQAGRLVEAEAIYAQLLMGAARNYPALHLMGLLRLQQGRLPEALELMHQALAVKPGAPDTLVNLGLVQAQLGRLDEAEAALRQAVAAQPGNMPARGNLGAVLLRLARPDEALAVLDGAAATGDPAILANRGMALKALGRPQEALDAFDRVLARAPGHREALEGRGAVLLDLQRPEEALADCDRLLELVPDHVAARGNRGTALWRLGRVDEALFAYDRVLAAVPDQPDVLANRANLNWTRFQALEPALADLEHLARLIRDGAAPAREDLAGDLLHLKMHAGDWNGLSAAKAALDDGVRAGRKVVEPFVYQGLSDSPADLRRCAEIAAARLLPPQAPVGRARPRREGRIRLGYLSGEFRAQATAYLAAGLYEAHDRSRFEVIAIDNTRDEASVMRSRLEAAFDRMIPIAGLGDDAAAAAIAAADIDILVNLNGWFGAHRMGVFARRPAPIQVNYLGFPGTLGAPCMDYILADSVVIEAGEERFFTEEVMRLPHCYQINDDRRGAPAPAPPRAGLGLPEDAFVFAHFNYPYKLMPAMFALWLRLLAAVPDSVLWLLEASPLFARNLRAAAGGAGVDPARLVFAPVLPHDEHMARIAAADLFLDSLPYGAHTTGSDALWAGLPLLTCRGRSFAGRVGASLLTALQMPELIAQDLAAYEARALELARDRAQLAALRAKLAEKRRTAPLFDTARTTRDIEAAYEQMLARAQAS